MNAPNPSQWRNTLTSMAITLLFVAIAATIAVHMLTAIEPALITIGAGAVAIYVVRIFRRRRNAGW
jgi:uncharacterized membrane protein